jgi:hypothetical protein
MVNRHTASSIEELELELKLKLELVQDRRLQTVKLFY